MSQELGFVKSIEVTHDDGTRYRWERGSVVGGSWRLRAAEPGEDFGDFWAHHYDPSDLMYDISKEIVKAESETLLP